MWCTGGWTRARRHPARCRLSSSMGRQRRPVVLVLWVRTAGNGVSEVAETLEELTTSTGGGADARRAARRARWCRGRDAGLPAPRGPGLGRPGSGRAPPRSGESKTRPHLAGRGESRSAPPSPGENRRRDCPARVPGRVQHAPTGIPRHPAARTGLSTCSTPCQSASAATRRQPVARAMSGRVQARPGAREHHTRLLPRSWRLASHGALTCWLATEGSWFCALAGSSGAVVWAHAYRGSSGDHGAVDRSGRGLRPPR